ncbi:hypothetical protein SESBI_14232 [Sesbania bispinosa]|nr:hypothetical protein SESBI_14232 [Sesbania bispinosa]
MNHDVKVHKEYGIVEVHRSRRYSKFDPFILAKNAIEVYYVPYPEKIQEKVDWWVVIKINPRGTVDDRYTLEVVYQDTTSNMNFVSNYELHGHLRDEGEYEEVDTIVGKDEVDNDEEDEVDENVEDDVKGSECDSENDCELLI